MCVCVCVCVCLYVVLYVASWGNQLGKTHVQTYAGGWNALPSTAVHTHFTGISPFLSFSSPSLSLVQCTARQTHVVYASLSSALDQVDR